jgi:hypothetical protein
MGSLGIAKSGDTSCRHFGLGHAGRHLPRLPGLKLDDVQVPPVFPVLLVGGWQ